MEEKKKIARRKKDLSSDNKINSYKDAQDNMTQDDLDKEADIDTEENFDEAEDIKIPENLEDIKKTAKEESFNVVVDFDEEENPDDMEASGETDEAGEADETVDTDETAGDEVSSEEDEDGSEKTVSKKSKVRRRIAIALGCVAALVIIAACVVYGVFMHYYGMMEYVEDDEITTMAAEDVETYSDDDDGDSFYVSRDILDEDGNVVGSTYEAVDYDSLTDEEKESVSAQVEEELSAASDEQQAALDMIASGQLYLPSETEAETVSVDKSEIYEEYEVETDADGTITSVVKDGVEYEVVSDDNSEVVISKKDTDSTSSDTDVVTVDTSEKDDVYNLLLIGTDLRANQSGYGRSDTMILISINNTDKEINMISFMRDLYADIPGYGVNKLNRAYMYGGGPLLIQTIEENYGITIDNYATVDFYSLIDIVDSIGGLTLAVSEEEAEVANTYIEQMCKAVGLDASSYYIQGSGELLLNGMQTVGFCRIRYAGASDFDRTQRQRTVLVAMFNKLKTQSVSEINTFLNAALPEVTHNISSTTLATLMMNAPTYLSYTVNQYRVPFGGYYSYSGEIIVPDFTYTISKLNSIIYY